MTIETNTYAAQATEAQVCFDDAPMTDAEYEDLIVRVEQENEWLFSVDHKEAHKSLSMNEQPSEAMTARAVWGPVQLIPVVLRKSDDVEELKIERIENGFVMDAPELCGDSQIGDCLVHECFVYRVMNEIMNCGFEAGCIFEEEYLFSREFLDSLDDQERDVLLDVALLLLKRHLGTERYEEMYASRFGHKVIRNKQRAIQKLVEQLSQDSAVDSDPNNGDLTDTTHQFPSRHVGGFL